MSSSFTISEAQTFTVTHARHMAAKVAADLKRLQRFYGKPTDGEIEDYESEVIELLKGGYLGTVTYGFRRDGEWIEPTLRYTARDLADSGASDDPGRIPHRADISGASFYSYLTYGPAWEGLSPGEREAVKDRLPFQRVGAPEPEVSGYFEHDRVYASGGRALERAIVRAY